MRPTGPSLIVLFLTVLIDLMGFGIVIPLLPIYAERLHATPFAAGALIAVYSLMQLLFAPVWGRLSDRVGRRPVLLVSLTGSAVSYLLLAGAWSLGVLFVARVLAGIAGANIPVAQAYIADVTSEADRTRGMGLIGAAFGLGMIVGPALGGGLSLLGDRVPECFAAGLCLVNVVIAARWLPESLPGARRRTAAFRHPLSPAVLRSVGGPGARWLAVFFLVTLGFAVLEGTFSLAAHHGGYDSSQVAGFWLYMGVVALVVQGFLVGRLARRAAERALVIAGSLLLALGLAGVGLTVRPAGLLAALALVVGGQGLASPALSSLISKTVEGSLHGEVLGVAQSLSAGARVLGPAAGGLVLQLGEVRITYLLAALCASAAVVLALGAIERQALKAAEVVPARRSSGS